MGCIFCEKRRLGKTTQPRIRASMKPANKMIPPITPLPEALLFSSFIGQPQSVRVLRIPNKREVEK
jgi:hypothetical protein